MIYELGSKKKPRLIFILIFDTRACMNNTCSPFLFRFMKPVRVGEDIVIDADTLKVGKTLAFCSVDIKLKSTGSLVAQGKHTKYVG